MANGAGGNSLSEGIALEKKTEPAPLNSRAGILVGDIYFLANIISPFLTSTLTASPSRNSPSSILMDSGS